MPEFTKSIAPNNLRYELKQSLDNVTDENSFWKNGANRGLIIFEELNTDDLIYNWKNSYELLLLPEKPLKISQLPNEIQKRLKPFRFENLKFADCQFLDISKYIYCEN